MKAPLTFILFLLVSFQTSAQKINKRMPVEYEGIVTQKEYEEILSASLEYLKSQEVNVIRVKDGGIEVLINGEKGTFYLDNLVRKCSSSRGEGSWDKIVAEHFLAILNRDNQVSKIDFRNYESVRQSLSIRMYPADFAKASGVEAGQLVFREDLPGIISVLMFDLPDAFLAVNRDSSAMWNKTDDELFKEALNNLAGQNLEEYTKDIGDSIIVTALMNDDYAASCILDSSRMKKYEGKYGAAVAIPAKGVVILNTMNDPVTFVKFIQLTSSMIESMSGSQPNPISKDYFWYYQGKWDRINVDETGKNFNVFSPAGLTDLMIAK